MNIERAIRDSRVSIPSLKNPRGKKTADQGRKAINPPLRTNSKNSFKVKSSEAY
jgi:hypothetical protein